MTFRPDLDDDTLKERVAVFQECGSKKAAARKLGIEPSTLRHTLKLAAKRGLLGHDAVLPGFEIAKITNTPKGDFIQQRPERLEEDFVMPEGMALDRATYQVANGKLERAWLKPKADDVAREQALRAALEGFKDKLPKAKPTPAPKRTIDDLLNQYTITDHHLGALAWNEETGSGDYDLKIAEDLIVDWFAAAISQAPAAKRAVFAQLGDFLHYDSFKSVTPEHGHLLDGDSRYPKMVRSAIRIVRRVLTMLLQKHETVDVIMCDANHDPAGEVWLREMLAAFYENEPRVRVDTTPGTYSVVEHGSVSLFLHHGHRRKIADVDSVFVGKYREVYGRTKHSYAHMGHLHNDELKTTNLMKVERHETLAAPDAYAANGGWLSSRSAKVITYHKDFGEVGRVVLTPAMVAGAAKLAA